LGMLSGRSWGVAPPRAKAWAILLDHFMVKNWHQP
jgi:hypothetical protein